MLRSQKSLVFGAKYVSSVASNCNGRLWSCVTIQIVTEEQRNDSLRMQDKSRFDNKSFRGAKRRFAIVGKKK